MSNCTYNAVWEECLSIIRQNVTSEQFETWFRPIGFVSFDKETKVVKLQVASNFVYEYLDENFGHLMCTVIKRVFGKDVRYGYITQVVKEGEGATGIAQPSQQKLADTRQSQDNARKAPQAELNSQLSATHTFETFIEGASNKLPRQLGLSIAQDPKAQQFNPMYVYGPSGCGKTHLVNAIGVKTRQMFPDKRVLYISARLFQVQYTSSVLSNHLNDFIHFYQTIDVLIVDDIQEWLSSPKTQQTFFHIFDHLFRNGKRIILACDRPPVDLDGMMERLITRFSCGLIAEIETPDEQLCRDILDNRVKRDGLSVPAEVIDYIAHTANGSVRDLEGVMQSLQAYSIVYNSRIDMRLVEKVLKRTVKTDNHPVTIDDIIQAVCQHYGVSKEDIRSRSRKQTFVQPRQVAMYLAQKHTKMPNVRIGKLIAGRDHTTVLHSCSVVEERMSANSAFADEVASIETALRLKQ